MSGESCWVCLATYNEAGNVTTLLEALHRSLPPAQVVVVDDSSPDGTGQVLDRLAAQEPWVHPLHRAGKLGYASAHREGIAHALAHGAQIVVTMDADFSHGPEYLPALVGGIEGGAEVVLGSRYVREGGIRGWPWYRHVLSGAANRCARLGLGLPLRDCTSGYRAYRADLLRRLRLSEFRSEGYSFLEEILVACALAGAKIQEVPIIFVERRVGRSEISRRVILEAMVMLAKLSWAKRFRSRTLRRELIAE